MKITQITVNRAAVSSIVVFAVVGVSLVSSCNEFVCGSIISKCLLTQSCQCKFTDCFCCKDCLNCLGELFTECCSCLELCPEHNETRSALQPKSQIADFEGIPELFNTLTADPEDYRWTTYTFPVSLSPSLLKTLQDLHGEDDDDDGDDDDEWNSSKGNFLGGENVVRQNCTVIYLNTCTSANKCLQYCESMGARSYRWFHDGCCECVGPRCINYGINESRCSECPDVEEDGDELDSEDYTNEDLWDYGEDDANY